MRLDNRFLPVVMVCFCLFTSRLPAQDATGRIVGVVSDPSGSVIGRAKVTATNAATNIAVDTYSSSDGSYQIPALPIGAYRISAEAPGFRRMLTEAAEA